MDGSEGSEGAEGAECVKTPSVCPPIGWTGPVSGPVINDIIIHLSTMHLCIRVPSLHLLNERHNGPGLVARASDSQSEKVGSNPACALKQGTLSYLLHPWTEM